MPKDHYRKARDQSYKHRASKFSIPGFDGGGTIDRLPGRSNDSSESPVTSHEPQTATRIKVVWWVVCDQFKVVGEFEYAKKEEAERMAAELTTSTQQYRVMKAKAPM